jgi:hypothetical protein
MRAGEPNKARSLKAQIDSERKRNGGEQHEHYKSNMD